MGLDRLDVKDLRDDLSGGFEKFKQKSRRTDLRIETYRVGSGGDRSEREQVSTTIGTVNDGVLTSARHSSAILITANPSTHIPNPFLDTLNGYLLRSGYGSHLRDQNTYITRLLAFYHFY